MGRTDAFDIQDLTGTEAVPRDANLGRGLRTWGHHSRRKRDTGFNASRAFTPHAARGNRFEPRG
jgi:hypothetical protein